MERQLRGAGRNGTVWLDLSQWNPLSLPSRASRCGAHTSPRCTTRRTRARIRFRGGGMPLRWTTWTLLAARCQASNPATRQRFASWRTAWSSIRRERRETSTGAWALRGSSTTSRSLKLQRLRFRSCELRDHHQAYGRYVGRSTALFHPSTMMT